MIEQPKCRQISIHPARGGYVVMVGCQTFIFTGVGALIEELDNYLRDPETVEKQYSFPGGELPVPQETAAAGGAGYSGLGLNRNR